MSSVISVVTAPSPPITTKWVPIPEKYREYFDELVTVESATCLFGTTYQYLCREKDTGEMTLLQKRSSKTGSFPGDDKITLSIFLSTQKHSKHPSIKTINLSLSYDNPEDKPDRGEDQFRRVLVSNLPNDGTIHEVPIEIDPDSYILVAEPATTDRVKLEKRSITRQLEIKPNTSSLRFDFFKSQKR